MITILTKRRVSRQFCHSSPSYGTGRLWGPGKLTEKKKTKEPAATSRFSGYIDCLSSSSHYKFFLHWFERFSREAQKERSSGRPSVHNPGQKLSAVQTAVDKALKPTQWHGIAWDFVEETVYAEHPKFGRLPVDALSDGIRNMIGLVSDIAHRASRLNPQFEAKAAIMTPGIILIDEVDMHLHPEWQQVVLQSLRDAFPLVQFVVATHSPQVLTTVSKANIRILDLGDTEKWSALMPSTSPLARPAGDALAYVMDVDPRPELDITSIIHSYENLVLHIDGSIEAISGVSRQDRHKAETTRNMLGLNAPSLKVDREKWIRQLLQVQQDFSGKDSDFLAQAPYRFILKRL